MKHHLVRIDAFVLASSSLPHTTTMTRSSLLLRLRAVIAALPVVVGISGLTSQRTKRRRKPLPSVLSCLGTRIGGAVALPADRDCLSYVARVSTLCIPDSPLISAITPCCGIIMMIQVRARMRRFRVGKLSAAYSRREVFIFGASVIIAHHCTFNFKFNWLHGQ
jgi:hypothetical protein